MNRTITRLILLLVTLWPLLYFVFIRLFAYDLLLTSLQIVSNPMGSNGFIRALFWIHVVTIAVMVLSFIVYTIHLYFNRLIPGNRKLLWLLAFLILTSFAFLFYWWRYIWGYHNPQSEPASFVGN